MGIVFFCCVFIHDYLLFHLIPDLCEYSSFFTGNRASADWYSEEQSQELLVRPKFNEKLLWRGQLGAVTGPVKLHC